MEVIYKVNNNFKINTTENKDNLKEVFNKKLLNIIIKQENQKLSDKN